MKQDALPIAETAKVIEANMHSLTMADLEILTPLWLADSWDDLTPKQTAEAKRVTDKLWTMLDAGTLETTVVILDDK